MSAKKTKPSDLVQITASPIPPWHQSTEFTTSCAVFYVESVIKGNKMPGGMESARGNEVHRTAAAITAYCALKKVPMDLQAFDNLSKGAGPVAAKILSGMRESFSCDWQHLISTELPMSLDENFQPTDVVEALDGICTDSGKPAHYSGVLDALYGFRDELRAAINDYKSHPRPFEPSETLQAKTYTVFVLAHFPWVQTVTFTLTFVRYKNLTRSVTYTRQDLPMLIEAIKSNRERQISIHVDYDAGKEMQAVAGGHCIYCPLLANAKCPIAAWNPAMQLTPEQRLNFNLFYSQFSKANNKAMKEYVQETGRNITLKDFNGKAYVYGSIPVESTVYPLFKKTVDGIAARCLQCGCILENIPLEGKCPNCGGGFVGPIMPIVDLIEEYAKMSPGDTGWMGKLAISSTTFGTYLDKKDRVILDQGIKDTVEKVPKVKLAVSRPLEMLPDDIFANEDEEEEF